MTEHDEHDEHDEADEAGEPALAADRPDDEQEAVASAPDEPGVPPRPETDEADLGRRDISPGYDVQARLFGAVGAWLTVVSIFYGAVSHEYAGTTFLALASGLSFLIAAYMGWQQPRGWRTAVERSAAEAYAETEEDEPWFPEASIWPFVTGAAIVLVGNGLLLGRWLLLPSLVFLAFALAGFTRQTRWRD
jgi:Cytochrome c oxidase subunit IV